MAARNDARCGIAVLVVVLYGSREPVGPPLQYNARARTHTHTHTHTRYLRESFTLVDDAPRSMKPLLRCCHCWLLLPHFFGSAQSAHTHTHTFREQGLTPCTRGVALGSADSFPPGAALCLLARVLGLSGFGYGLPRQGDTSLRGFVHTPT